MKPEELKSAPINVEELLDDIEFPVMKDEIVGYAEENDASLEALQLLEAMPNREYKSIEDINSGLGLIGETATEENLY